MWIWISASGCTFLPGSSRSAAAHKPLINRLVNKQQVKGWRTYSPSVLVYIVSISIQILISCRRPSAQSLFNTIISPRSPPNSFYLKILALSQASLNISRQQSVRGIVPIYHRRHVPPRLLLSTCRTSAIGVIFTI